ncbi:hypothetical protein LOK49_LG06G00109 [Camellia lanceoleosa]|uniref:Uncharacterized protein n=1 Tax=Camellia lanceoleosa TaxID=1840588 RepID=A0ACC0HBT0_9ERIC|nr:hypothetical protein LOK49_LG06G00109 [Camellia lanceoleosa]
MIVRMATERVYPDAERFKAYAILSDGVVIGDTRVAVEYKSMLTELQNRYNVKDFFTLLRLAGAGYRVLARARAHLEDRYERVSSFPYVSFLIKEQVTFNFNKIPYETDSKPDSGLGATLQGDPEPIQITEKGDTFSTVKEGSLKHALTLDEDGKEAFPKPLVVEEMICQTSRDLKEVFEYDEAPEDVLQWAISQTKVLAMIGNMTPLTIRVTSEQKTETQELNLSP